MRTNKLYFILSMRDKNDEVEILEYWMIRRLIWFIIYIKLNNKYTFLLGFGPKDNLNFS